MRKIFLLRHGNTGYVNKYIGSTNVSLSNKGIDEVAKLRKFIHNHDFDKVICSPLRRCLQTCDLLNLEQSIIIDDRIREVNFGIWEEKTFAEIQKSDRELVDSWAEAAADFRFPDGEKISDFKKRISDFGHYIQSLNNNRLLIVTHGGVIRHLICFFLNLPYDNYLYFKIESGKVTTIDLHNQGGVMTGMNIGVIHE